MTDGAADVPPGVAEALGIEVVHGAVRLDGNPWRGTTEEFWRAIESGAVPSTAPPTVEQFREAFTDVESACAVVVSAELSRTFAHAEAAAESNPSVPVVDSRSLSVGTGLLAVLAAEGVRQESEVGRLKVMLPSLVTRLHVYAVIENVDYLIRGGRAGLIETARHPGWRQLVAVKGHVIPLEQVHRRPRAVDALLQHVGEHLTHGVQQWAVGHGNAADVDEFVHRTAQLFATRPQFVVPLGAPVGTHAGPGALMLAFLASG